jgi:hypothetical protein
MSAASISGREIRCPSDFFDSLSQEETLSAPQLASHFCTLRYRWREPSTASLANVVPMEWCLVSLILIKQKCLDAV